MRFFYKDLSGQVYEYQSQEEREIFGPPDLTAMTPEEVVDHLNSVDTTVYVPLSVTMRQARLALHAAGLLGQVESAIDALPEPRRTEARIEWDYASEVHRGSSFVTLLGATLELDEQALDDLFLKAVEL